MSGTRHEPMLTITEASEWLKVSVKTVRRRISAGEIAVVRIGRCLRIHPGELYRIIDTTSRGGRS